MVLNPKRVGVVPRPPHVTKRTCVSVSRRPLFDCCCGTASHFQKSPRVACVSRSPVKRHDAFCRPSFSPCSLSLFAFRGVIFEAHLPSQRVFMQRPRLRWARPFWLTQVFTHVRVTPSVFCSWHSLLREDPHPASPRPAPCTEEGAANDISLLSSVSLATRVTKTTHVYVSICTCM